MKQYCKTCKYDWDYNGKYSKEKVDYPVYITCPRCYSKVRIRGGKI